MAGSSWKNWIANADQETAVKPADLGYFVGYKIYQSYCQEMTDKKPATHDILNISDYPAFLTKSRYAEKLATRQAAPGASRAPGPPARLAAG